MEQIQIEQMIYIIRGQKVMMDSDLAELYGVSTRDLGKQVRRNITRFPGDFLILPNSKDLENLRFQSGTANGATAWNHMRRSTPMLFTENGIAMLSSVLNSERAVNISIIRIFTQLRSFLAMENANSEKINKLEKNTNKLFKIVFERMDQYEEMVTPKLPANRNKIGLKKTKD